MEVGKYVRYLLVIFLSSMTGMGVFMVQYFFLKMPYGISLMVATAEAGLVGYLIAFIYIKHLAERGDQ